MSTERSDNTANRQVIDEAVAWFVEINEGQPDREARERFDEWLRRSPEHARAYLRIVPVWEKITQLDVHAVSGNPDALIAWAREGSNVVPLEVARGDTEVVTRSTKRKRPWALVASAAVLCAALILTAWWLGDRRVLYETGIGEQRLIALNDGSRVMLNARSKLSVRFSERERSVELVAGQALFRVAKHTGWPFIVRSGDVGVRAIGTRFDVYRKRSATIVTVVEGRVEVVPAFADNKIPESIYSRPKLSTVLLSAGEQTMVRSKQAPKKVSVNATSATAWTEQRLEFSNTPLSEVAEEFNRYNERQLVLRAGLLQNFYVTGTFSSSDPASLMTFLRAQDGIKVEELKDEIVISQE